MRRFVAGLVLVLALVVSTTARSDETEYGQMCMPSGCPDTPAEPWYAALSDPELAPYVDGALTSGSWCQRTWDCLFGRAVEDQGCGRELTTKQWIKVVNLYRKICGSENQRPPQ